MKKNYVEPELELVKFRFDAAVMSDLTIHSQTEYGGQSGVLIGDDGDEHVIEP